MRSQRKRTGASSKGPLDRGGRWLLCRAAARLQSWRLLSTGRRHKQWRFPSPFSQLWIPSVDRGSTAEAARPPAIAPVEVSRAPGNGIPPPVPQILPRSDLLAAGREPRNGGKAGSCQSWRRLLLPALVSTCQAVFSRYALFWLIHGCIREPA